MYIKDVFLSDFHQEDNLDISDIEKKLINQKIDPTKTIEQELARLLNQKVKIIDYEHSLFHELLGFFFQKEIPFKIQITNASKIRLNIVIHR